MAEHAAMQLTLTLEAPSPPSEEIILGIMRRIGPIRLINLCGERGLPDDTWEVCKRLIDMGQLVCVGEVRFKGVVPEWHTDKVYAAKDCIQQTNHQEQP